MQKIGKATLLGNLASVSLSMKMVDIKKDAELAYLGKRIEDLYEAAKPARSLTVATLIINSFIYGTEFASINNQGERA